jgi:hypothetical protein
MADYKVVQFRRGTTVQTSTFTGAPGEITVDTDKWTAVVHDGHTVGGFPLKVEAVQYPRIRYLMYRAAAVQQGVASLGFSAPFGQGPQAIAYVDNGIITGVASFAIGQAVQDHFLLPLDWTTPLALDAVWRTNSTIGTVSWKLESCCVPVGTTINDSAFGTPQVVPVIASGRPNEFTTTTINIDTTGFVPEGEFFYRFTRDSSDTVNAPVELISLRFSVRILEN